MEPYTIDPTTQWENSLKVLDQFNAYRVPYKHVNDQPIHAFFVIPKNLPSGPRPLLVRFHGGGWTEGEADASLRPFFLELALKHSAIILTPDYRLRPEHEMTDGIDDVCSFWKWVEDDASLVLQTVFPDIDLDVTNLLVGGESAGGYHSVQTALLSWTTLPIKVLFLQYPALDISDDFSPAKLLSREGFDASAFPYSIIEEHLAKMEKGAICTRARFGTRMHLTTALVLADRFCDIEGERAWINPIVSLEGAGKLPPILLYHSKEDEAIPWQKTERWAKRLGELQPDVPLYLTYQMGDHVFDRNDNMETPWLKEPLEFVRRFWPAGGDA